MFLGSGKGGPGGQSLKCFNHHVVASVLLQTQSKGNAPCPGERTVAHSTRGCKKGTVVLPSAHNPCCCCCCCGCWCCCYAAGAATAAATLAPLPTASFAKLHKNMRNATRHNVCAEGMRKVAARALFTTLPYQATLPGPATPPTSFGLASTAPPRFPKLRSGRRLRRAGVPMHRHCPMRRRCLMQGHCHPPRPWFPAVEGGGLSDAAELPDAAAWPEAGRLSDAAALPKAEGPAPRSRAF